MLPSVESERQKVELKLQLCLRGSQNIIVLSSDDGLGPGLPAISFHMKGGGQEYAGKPSLLQFLYLGIP